MAAVLVQALRQDVHTVLIEAGAPPHVTMAGASPRFGVHPGRLGATNQSPPHALLGDTGRDPVALLVPLEVSVASGRKWGSMSPLNL